VKNDLIGDGILNPVRTAAQERLGQTENAPFIEDGSNNASCATPGLWDHEVIDPSRIRAYWTRC